MAKQWSKRMASSRRHKIDRKKREAKRDIRKAAKALSAAGQGRTRTKKSREIAKSVLRIPKSSAQKEEVLNKLLVARQRQKEMKARKREGARAAGGAPQSRKRSRSGSPSRQQEDGAEDDEADEEDDEAEESDEGEEELEESGGDEEAEATSDAGAEQPPAAAAAQRNASSMKRLLIPTHLAGNYGEQLVRFLDSAVFTGATAAARFPIAFLVVVDARCPVQTCPWPELDAILQRAAGEAQPSAVKPLVVFALAKADLVAAQTLAADYKTLSDAIADRYYPLYASDKAPEGAAQGKRKGRKSQQPLAATADRLPVDFALCPFSPEIEGTTRQLLRVLRKYEETLRAEQAAAAAGAGEGDVEGAARPSKANLAHNMFRKLAVLVIGLPKTGKSTLVSAITSIGSDSSVASAQVNRLFVQSGSSGDDQRTARRVLIPSPKAITLLYLPDHPGAVNKHTVLAGDIIFASEAVVDKLDAPEAVATLLLEQLPAPQLVELAQNFSLAAPPALLERIQEAESSIPPSAANSAPAPAENGEQSAATEKVCISLLKSLGRVVVRDRGFVPTTYTGVLDQGVSGRGAAASDPLTASSVHSASFTSGGRRIVRVWPLKTDGRNPLKVGARTLLQEFRRSRYLPWAVVQSPTGRPLNSYDHPCVFSNRYLGKDGEVTRDETARSNSKQSAASRNAETFLPGLQALQRALVAYVALLPRYCISIPPTAIVAPVASIPGAAEGPEQQQADESRGGESETEGEA